MASVARVKPKADDYEIDYRRGEGWVLILPNGETDGRIFANRNSALSAKGQATRKAAEQSRCKERACLRCGDMFLSEGPHNRMCNPCRHHGSAEGEPCSFGTLHGRRRGI